MSTTTLEWIQHCISMKFCFIGKLIGPTIIGIQHRYTIFVIINVCLNYMRHCPCFCSHSCSYSCSCFCSRSNTSLYPTFVIFFSDLNKKIGLSGVRPGQVFWKMLNRSFIKNYKYNLPNKTKLSNIFLSKFESKIFKKFESKKVWKKMKIIAKITNFGRSPAGLRPDFMSGPGPVRLF